MTIEHIRDNIHNHIGNVAKIKHNEGRNRILEYEGKVIETKVDNKGCRIL